MSLHAHVFIHVPCCCGWAQASLPPVWSASSAHRTFSSRSNRKHRADTACLGAPTSTTGRSCWLHTHTRVFDKILHPPAESPTSSTYCSNFHRLCPGRGSALSLGALTPLRLLLRSEELALRWYSAGWGSACYWGKKQDHKGAIT